MRIVLCGCVCVYGVGVWCGVFLREWLAAEKEEKLRSQRLFYIQVRDS